MSMRLIKEVHKILLKGVCDEHKTPGNELAKIGKKIINGQRLLELLYSNPKVNFKLVNKKIRYNSSYS